MGKFTFSLEDQLISEVSSKWNLGETCSVGAPNEHGVVRGRTSDIAMDIDDTPSEDDDISMRDYTEEDLVANFEAEEKDDKTEGEINTTGTTLATPTSLIRKVFSPEQQGYALGCATIEQQDIGKEEQERCVDDHKEEVRTAYEGVVAPTATAHTSSMSRHDEGKTIIINNYFISAGRRDYGENISEGLEFDAVRNDYDDDYEHECLRDHNRFNFVFLFETLKRSINYSIILVVGYLIFRKVDEDLRLEYAKLNIRDEYHRRQCFNEYNVNKCAEYGQLPALKQECLEWEICFNGGNTNQFRSMFYSELFIHVSSRLLDETLSNIGNMNKAFLMTCLLMWYIGNFACGYVKGINERHGELGRFQDGDESHHKMGHVMEKGSQLISRPEQTSLIPSGR